MYQFYKINHLAMMAMLAIFFIFPSLLLAHGTQGAIKINQSLLIRAKYSTGEPMAYANIKIFHNQDKIPFQQGNLDKNGLFLFHPDQKGIWVAKINDGMGHALSLETKVSNPRKLTQKTPSQGNTNISKIWKLLMGISIIFGLSGIFFWWKGISKKGQ